MKEAGGIIIDGVQKGSTLQCPHCGCHFISVPGSGITRAFCFGCMAVTCGRNECNTCIPLEAQLEHREGSKTQYDTVIKDMLEHGGILL